MSSSTGSKAAFLSSMADAFNKYLPNSFAESHTIIDSSALTQIFYTSCKNIPYSFLANEFGINDVAHFFSSRIKFLESSILALASMVHHLFFALLYTGLVLVTAGSFQSISDSCTAHWTHVSHAAMAIMIAVVGVVAPYYGTYTCGGVAYYLLDSVEGNYRNDLNWHENDLLAKIRTAVDNNWYEITQAVKLWVKNDDRYGQVFLPAMEQAKEKIEFALTVDEVAGALWEAKSVFVDKNYDVVNNQKNS